MKKSLVLSYAMAAVAIVTARPALVLADAPTSTLAVKSQQLESKAILEATRTWRTSVLAAKKQYAFGLDKALRMAKKKGETNEAQRIQAEFERVQHEIAELGAERVFLGSLRHLESKVGYGKLGLGGRLGHGNGTVKVAKKAFKHSISLHAKEDGSAFVRYSLNSGYSRLQGAVALCDTAKKPTSAFQFRVFGDGRLIWESTGIREKEQVVKFDVDVAGVDDFRLVVDCSGNSAHGHTVWLDPVLVR